MVTSSRNSILFVALEWMVRKRRLAFDYLQVCSRRWPPLTVISGSERSVNLLFSPVSGVGRGHQVETFETECWHAELVGGCARLDRRQCLQISWLLELQGGGEFR
jgi:hypothetical protein